MVLDRSCGARWVVLVSLRLKGLNPSNLLSDELGFSSSNMEKSLVVLVVVVAVVLDEAWTKLFDDIGKGENAADSNDFMISTNVME